MADPKADTRGAGLRQECLGLMQRNNNRGRYDERITLHRAITTSMRPISQVFLGGGKDFVVRCKQVVFLRRSARANSVQVESEFALFFPA
jgi:hypothetical protein